MMNDKMEAFNEICNRLRNHSYKLTPQRQTILKIFLDNIERHLSAEEVYQLVKEKYPDIGLATIYRTLDILAELDILQKNDFGDGRSRFEFTRKDDEHHHHHLICAKCGEVQEFGDDLLETLEDLIETKNEFKVLDHDLKFYGYCKKCLEKLS